MHPDPAESSIIKKTFRHFFLVGWPVKVTSSENLGHHVTVYQTLCDNLNVDKLSQSVSFLTNLVPRMHVYGEVSHHRFPYASLCDNLDVDKLSQCHRELLH
eukprot:COSAG02_NODE_3985_length_5949_cov_7.533846_4_plen_101_part_00